MSITVEDAKLAKGKLKSDIRDLLDAFAQATGLVPRQVEVITFPTQRRLDGRIWPDTVADVRVEVGL